MQHLLRFSRLVDRLNTFVGKYVIWLILISTVISAINAVVRKVFDMSSNALLEVQWYLFAASFLMAAGYTLLQGEHIKVDVIISRFFRRTQVWLEIFGFVAFLLPVCLAILWFGIPFFINAWHSGEMSNNPGGLIRWPVYLMLPLGFTLLLLQCGSELVKRIAFLRGLIEDPALSQADKTAAADLAESIRRLTDITNNGDSSTAQAK